MPIRFAPPAAGVLLTLLAWLVAPLPVVAQASSVLPVALPNTQVRRLTASANGVEYTLYVSLPPGYSRDAAKYPVMYLLDADYSFAVARNITEHLTERQHLPAVVLVAIAYGGPPAYRLNRTRDYTPIFSPDGGYGAEYQRVSGGGPRFLAFIRDELIPFIEGEYHVSQDRALVGHSYGGLFVLWAMLNEPTLFRRVIAVSPSLWYHDRWMFGLEEEVGRRVKSMPVRLYGGVGSREGNSRITMWQDLRQFTDQLRTHGYAGLEQQVHVLEDETHNSVFPIAFTKGLRWVYRDLGAR